MLGSGSTDNTSTNAATGSRCFTLDELQHEIAKNDDWRTAFLYLPRASKANLKFHQLPQFLSKTCRLPVRLLIGGSYKPGFQSTRLYAEVSYSPSASSHLVDVRHFSGTLIGLHRSMKNDEVKLLQNVVYVEPFNLLERVASPSWRKCLRFLVLYYFLEQRIMTTLSVTSEGLKALKRACTSIANDSRRTAKEGVRPPLKFRTTPIKQITNPDRINPQSSNNLKDKDGPNPNTIKQELLPASVPVRATENDSTRAIPTVVLNDAMSTNLLLPELRAAHGNSSRNENGEIQNIPMTEHNTATSQLKRKRPDEETFENANAELIFDRCKQIVHLKGEKLTKDETALRNTLDEHTKTLHRAHTWLKKLQEDLKEAQSRLKTAEEAKAITEADLGKVRKELASHHLFEQGFDTYRA